MPLDLSQKLIDPNDPANAPIFSQLQANILKGHGRNHSIHLFFAFTHDQPSGIGLALKGLPLSSAADQAQHHQQREKEPGYDGGTICTLALSKEGMERLGATLPGDRSFAAGMPSRQGCLGDPPVKDWDAGFQQAIHAMVLLADDHADRLEQQAQAVVASLAEVAQLVTQERGVLLKNADGNVINHYDIVDGLSQPVFLTTDLERYKKRQGLEDVPREEWKYDPAVKLGEVLVADVNGPNADCYGSYGVYRKLHMDATKFWEGIEGLSKELNEYQTNPDYAKQLATGYVIGRFKDGTPIITHDQPTPGDPRVPNDFNYLPDPQGTKCPYSSHMRKVNPRSDIDPKLNPNPSLARRAISYGQPGEADKGLLFLCMQGSIEEQFEQIQIIWANNQDFINPGTGIDPVVGQRKLVAAGEGHDNRCSRDVDPPSYGETPELPYGDAPAGTYKNCYPREYGIEPLGWKRLCQNEAAFTPYDFARHVTMRGGLYLYYPSLGYLQNL